MPSTLNPALVPPSDLIVMLVRRPQLLKSIGVTTNGLGSTTCTTQSAWVARNPVNVTVTSLYQAGAMAEVPMPQGQFGVKLVMTVSRPIHPDPAIPLELLAIVSNPDTSSTLPPSKYPFVQSSPR